jgi:hypothetical protein
MIAIPGEETPTDPASALAFSRSSKSRPQVEAPRCVHGGGSRRWGCSSAALAPIGTRTAKSPRPWSTGNIEDEIYIVPLSAHRDLGPQERRRERRQRPPLSSTARHPASTRRRRSAKVASADPPATGGTVEEPTLDPIEGSLGSFDATLGGLGPNVKKSDIEGIVLSDPTQINTMVKRVMSKGQPQLRHCYEARLKEDAGLKGAWNVQFQLQPSGHAARSPSSPSTRPTPSSRRVSSGTSSNGSS